MVFRTIATDIPKFEKLNLPPVLKDVVDEQARHRPFRRRARAPASRPSMAAMIDYRNEN